MAMHAEISAVDIYLMYFVYFLNFNDNYFHQSDRRQ